MAFKTEHKENNSIFFTTLFILYKIIIVPYVYTLKFHGPTAMIVGRQT